MTDQFTDFRMAQYALTRSAQTLIGICAGLTADGKLNDAEIAFIQTWLAQNIEVTTIWPGSAIAARIEQVMKDGVITDAERADLINLLQSLSGNEFAETGSAAPSGPAVPYDEISEITFSGRSFCLTGTFFFGTRAACEKLLSKLGGEAVGTVTGKLDYLIVGSGCSEQWANTTYGRKIEAAIERKQRYGKPVIISEKAWVEAIKSLETC